MCVRACVRVCVCVRACVRVRVYVLTYMAQLCLQPFRVCMRVYWCACLCECVLFLYVIMGFIRNRHKTTSDFNIRSVSKAP